MEAGRITVISFRFGRDVGCRGLVLLRDRGESSRCFY